MDSFFSSSSTTCRNKKANLRIEFAHHSKVSPKWRVEPLCKYMTLKELYKETKNILSPQKNRKVPYVQRLAKQSWHTLQWTISFPNLFNHLSDVDMQVSQPKRKTHNLPLWVQPIYSLSNLQSLLKKIWNSKEAPNYVTILADIHY